MNRHIFFKSHALIYESASNSLSLFFFFSWADNISTYLYIYISIYLYIVLIVERKCGQEIVKVFMFIYNPCWSCVTGKVTPLSFSPRFIRHCIFSLLKKSWPLFSFLSFFSRSHKVRNMDALGWRWDGELSIDLV